jgi:serine phosphatase RsbU (regulator of sigma subunit)
MSQQHLSTGREIQDRAQQAERKGDWRAAADMYAHYADQRSAELALINSVQEGLSAKLAMQDIYDLVGDKLRDTFNAQVVMISQYDASTHKILHHYAYERGQHLQIDGWQPIDSSRAAIVRTGRPFMINLDTIIEVVEAGTMQVVPGTELPKTWLGVPMLVGKEVRGMVSLQNLDRENAFSNSDINLLTMLTNSMSQSLENARLFKETQRLLRLMEGEMLIAEQTQRGILPLDIPHHAAYDFGALIKPARAVGGDFYDFIRLDKDRLSLVIGDVSDKGLPAALFMALTFSSLRAETERFDDPHQIVLAVNRDLLKMNASSMFVTLLYGILECHTGTFTYVRAGHMPPLIMVQDRAWVDVALGVGQPLGLFDAVELDAQRVILPPGGLVLLYSDGLNEAFDTAGNEFGLERIQQELVARRNESAQAICDGLWQAVEAYSAGAPQHDDFTVMVIKRHRATHDQWN